MWEGVFISMGIVGLTFLIQGIFLRIVYYFLS